jgi:regulator of nonsense transcripts 1
MAGLLDFTEISNLVHSTSSPSGASPGLASGAPPGDVNEEEAGSSELDDDAADNDDDDDDDDEDDDSSSDEDDSGDDDDESVANNPYYTSAVASAVAPIPAHACSYCHISNPNCVVKCIETNKWFCSSATNGTSNVSHIINHLVRSRSNTIQLHPDSAMGSTTLECYNCTSRNIFTLGFVPAKGDSVVVLLCRICVETVPALKDMEWDVAGWTSVVTEKKFVDWLVHAPSESDLVNARDVSSEQLSKLEDLWKNKPDALLTDIDKEDVEGGEEFQSTLVCYEDGYHYQNILSPLIKLEADYDRAMKEALSESSINIEWEKSISGKHVAAFSFGRDDSESRVMVGDELVLSLSTGSEFLYGKEWSGRGYVKSIYDGVIYLEIGSYRVPENIKTGWIVEFVWKPTSYERMQNALKTFAIDDSSVSGYIYHSLLGHAVEEATLDNVTMPKDLDAPGLPQLNDSQKNVLENVLQRPFSLIQGPPGTGKTVTSASLVYHMANQKIGQVLVCAPSNVAVDHLSEKISMTGLKVVRMSSKTWSQQVTQVDHLCLHTILLKTAGKDFMRLQKLLDETGDLNEKDNSMYKKLKFKYEREILKAADIICCTCVMAGDIRLNNFRFRQVLIDEATQAVEAEALIPITLGCKQLVLVGDHLQLPPVVMCKQSAKLGLTQSLFERLVLTGCRPVRLLIQYRMHPALAEFPSNMFYEGSLGNGVSAAEREPEDGKNFPWPTTKSKPLMFYNCSAGIEEISASGTSYLNRTEAAFVEKTVTHLLKMGVKGENIGVITPYDGQRVYVSEFIKRSGPLGAAQYEPIEIASVDAFQGREKDYIIISCVRSSETGGIGFLADPRRLNVGITRARLGLIIIGNARVLCKNILWSAMILHFRENESLVEGSLNNLTPSFLLISKPRSNKQDNERYLNTALARGGWTGRWDDAGARRSRGGPRMGRGSGYRSSKKVPGMDSRHDAKYANLNSVAEDEASTANFAPLPGFDGGYDYNDESTQMSQSTAYGTQQYYASTQGSQGYSQEISAYMNNESSRGETQSSQFSQESGFSDYYYDGGSQFSQDSTR